MQQRKETLSRKRTYAFKRVQIHPEKKDQPEVFSSLYIGLDFWKVYPMMNEFTTASFAVDFKPAIHTITRLAQTPNAYAVVLFDASLPIADLEDFLGHMQEKELFSRLVIIGDITKCTEQQIKLLKKVEFVDDLVLLNEPQLLKRKTLFYQKIKQANYEQLAASKVQMQMSLPKLSLAILQRAFDMFFSALLLALLAPLFIILAAVIRMDSAGSIFVISHGRGSRYQKFRFLRFRTTATAQSKKLSDLQLLNGSSEQSLQFDLGEPQVTRVGQFLKATNLDELPSLVNVLLGDISFLGNRMA